MTRKVEPTIPCEEEISEFIYTGTLEIEFKLEILIL